jgi:hypothetical protein
MDNSGSKSCRNFDFLHYCKYWSCSHVSNNPFQSKVTFHPLFFRWSDDISAFNVFAQFTCRVWHPTEKGHYAWSSTNLESFTVDEKTKKDFNADRVKLSLSEDLSTYTFVVSINPKTIIDVHPHYVWGCL